MKIRIEGCTAEVLAECSEYLSIDKEYDVLNPEPDECVYVIVDDFDDEIVCGKRHCAHLPLGAEWEVVE